jgi:plastocyanin
MMQLGEGLAGLLSPDEARAARKELSDIGVRVIRVGTLFDQMSFDKERLVVQAGKPVEFVFENTDIMPHNFVIGNRARWPTRQTRRGHGHDADAARDIMCRNRQTSAGKQTVASARSEARFMAPKEPGVYPFVCTFLATEHARRSIVEDLEAYQPREAYLAKANIPIKDPLLKDRRPHRMEVRGPDRRSEGHQGRSQLRQRQADSRSPPARLPQDGRRRNSFGADLAQLDPKLKFDEVFKDVIEPSSKINEKFQTWTIETVNGKKFTEFTISGVTFPTKFDAKTFAKP